VQFTGSIAAPVIRLEQSDSPLDVVALYTSWIDWVHEDFAAHAMFPAAFRPVGGDAKTATTAVGKVVFLQPPWSLRLWEGDQELTVVGELYPEGGVGTVFRPTDGDYTAIVQLQTPSYSELLSVNTGSGLDAAQAQQLTDTNARALELYRLMGLDPSNPVVLSQLGSGVLRLLVGSLIQQAVTPTRDASGQLTGLQIARST
jgi:hypothetical protein